MYCLMHVLLQGPEFIHFYILVTPVGIKPRSLAGASPETNKQTKSIYTIGFDA